ncbi:MAG: cupin domain-containing protein [Deltaproteobacteria bacterium]|nr:cupin domain-containing protein [Deltaproteobacteria bacterium]
MTTDETLEQVHERVALYTLGALAPEEVAVVEARLAAGEARYVAALAEHRAIADHLAYAAAPQAPSPAARARVLARVAGEAASGVVEQDGVRVVFGSQIAWQPSPLPGVEFKLLREDAVTGRRTRLIRIAPGAEYPKHRHAQLEEVALLEGDLMVNGVLMHPGDYCSAEDASVHHRVYSPSGCVFIVTAGDNEFID